MRHVDFFSGAVSGFSFAASYVWSDCEHVALCEIDPWRRKQLGILWPGVPIIGDVKDEESIAAYTTQERTYRGRDAWARRREFTDGDSGIFLATFSPPCQASSCAGLRLGTKDPRWLWPQAIRALEITKPEWAIFENPTGFLSIDGGLAYESVCAGVERAGYWVETFIIPASAAGAWHRRDRVWIVAHLESQDDGRRNAGARERSESELGSGTCPGNGRSVEEDGTKARNWDGPNFFGEGLEDYEPLYLTRTGFAASANPPSQRRRTRRTEPAGQCGVSRSPECGSEFVGTHPDKTRLAFGEMQPGDLREKFSAVVGDSWNMHWLQAVGDLCDVVDDGKRDHRRDIIEAERSKWIAALGDSIVPQAVIPIMQSIKEATCCVL